jgi:hypothetical protein
MSDKPEIEKMRILHDLGTKFDVPDAVRSTLRSQIANQNAIERFVRGFRIEDWFEWIFSTMPWIKLIHGLDQQQFPSWSKQTYQVPDFLLLVETSALTIKPLAVEVKCVPGDKMTLKLQDSQVDLCQSYASTLGIPLVCAIYWEKLSGWTMNTVDSFERRTSTYKIPLTTAFELDCSGIVGDMAHLIFPGLVRIARFSKQDVTDKCMRHEKFGRRISDVAVMRDKRVEMVTLESAAIDSMMEMKALKVTEFENGETELIEGTEDLYLLKLSSWVTRHIAIFQAEPNDTLANMSANYIVGLMKKLDCPIFHMFPMDRTEELKRLDRVFWRGSRVAKDPTPPTE